MKPLKCPGIGRPYDEPKVLALYLDRPPTDDEMRAIHEAVKDALKPRPRVRHRKRGSTYTVVDRAVRLQVEPGTPLGDNDMLVLYQDTETGHRSVRLPDEFDDGRFEPLTRN